MSHLTQTGARVAKGSKYFASRSFILLISKNFASLLPTTNHATDMAEYVPRHTRLRLSTNGASVTKGGGGDFIFLSFILLTSFFSWLCALLLPTTTMTNDTTNVAGNVPH